MTGDSRRSPTRHNKIWNARDITFCPRGGRSGTGAACTAERRRLTLMSCAPPPQVGGTNMGTQAAGGGAHRCYRSIRAVLLVPECKDQEPPEIAAVVRLEIGVIPDHLVHVGRTEEALLAQALLGQDIAHVVVQVMAEPGGHRHVEPALLAIENLAGKPMCHGPLEEILLAQAPELQLGRDRRRELDQLVVDERDPRLERMR